jgi:large subunit ribosomal protein L25
MSEVTLEAQRREAGRSNARSLRRQSRVPGIFYFHGEEPIPISVHELALRPLIYTTESHLVRMRLDDGSEKTCVLKDMSFDPITDRPTHFDLQGVAANETIRVEIPIVLVGQSVGQRNSGGIIEFSLHKLEVECFPHDIPDHIEVDITDLDINQGIHVSDLLKVSNFTIVTSPDLGIVSITPPRTGADDTATITEPEVITKGKGDE